MSIPDRLLVRYALADLLPHMARMKRLDRSQLAAHMDPVHGFSRPPAALALEQAAEAVLSDGDAEPG